MALRKRFCRSFDFELQAAATDDGVLLSPGPQHLPLESILELLDPEGLRELEQAPSRRRCSARASGGTRRDPPPCASRGSAPAPLLRMRSDDLLAAVFPAQTGCQDNHGVGARIDPPDHPLVNETLRDCLTEVMDAEGLAVAPRKLKSGEIRFPRARRRSRASFRTRS